MAGWPTFWLRRQGCLGGGVGVRNTGLLCFFGGFLGFQALAFILRSRRRLRPFVVLPFLFLLGLGFWLTLSFRLAFSIFSRLRLLRAKTSMRTRASIGVKSCQRTSIRDIKIIYERSEFGPPVSCFFSSPFSSCSKSWTQILSKKKNCC